MFYFRINKVKVFDNRESAFLLFKRDLAQVKIMSFVTTNNVDLPNLDPWMAAIDPAEKQTILAQAVDRVVASRILTEIDNVKDNHTLTFGDTEYVLYQPPGIPDDFNLSLNRTQAVPARHPALPE
jgi:hypothetical protein